MPVLTVAEQGYSFIRGEYAADIQFIENLFQHDLPQIESNDMELFQQLRTLRKDIAKDLQIPAYWICIDRALFDLTRKKPTTKEDLLSVHGIGDTFVEKYGERFIETINCYLSTVYENTNIIDQDKQNSDICSQPAISPSIEAVAIKDDAINKRLEAEFVKLLKEMLSERESTVVIMRLGLADGYSRTLAEIGEMLGVTRERIRQIEKKALRRLRHPSKKINIPGDFDIVKFRKDPSIYDSLFNTLNERLPFKTDSSQNNGRQSADSTEQDDREQPSAISMVGQAWTSEEDERLIKSFDAGSSIEDLASRHRRNWGGIRARLNRFGRVVEEKEDIQSKLDK
jgi:RNA polymerase sigma factor (sigma-70 family)